LQCQTCELSWIGQTCCCLEQRYKEHIRYITSSEPQYEYPPHIFTISMNMDPWISLCPYDTQTTEVVRNVYIHLFQFALLVLPWHRFSSILPYKICI
jgi:hypothetical protein